MHDLVIRGGTIVDGTGAPAFTGDLPAVWKGRRAGRQVNSNPYPGIRIIELNQRVERVDEHEQEI